MARPKAGYFLADGTRIPGVTTITGRFKDSGGLLHWAFQQGQSGAASLYEKRDEAGIAGNFAHDMVEASIHGQEIPQTPPDMAADTAKAAMNGFMAYQTWKGQSGLKIIETETPLVSELYRFGGTPDAIGLMSNALCLIDWKTSNGVYPDFLIQIAAYKQLWEENFPDRPIIGGFHLCRFAKEHGDFAHHYYSELDDAWEMFKLLRQAYDLDKKLKQRTK